MKEECIRTITREQKDIVSKADVYALRITELERERGELADKLQQQQQKCGRCTSSTKRRCDECRCGGGLSCVPHRDIDRDNPNPNRKVSSVGDISTKFGIELVLCCVVLCCVVLCCVVLCCIAGRNQCDALGVVQGEGERSLVLPAAAPPAYCGCSRQHL